MDQSKQKTFSQHISRKLKNSVVSNAPEFFYKKNQIVKSEIVTELGPRVKWAMMKNKKE